MTQEIFLGVAGLFVGVLGVVVAIVGSVLGIFPVRALSRKQTEIRDQITTQGIAPFPQHLQHIAELVGEANVSIDIMADCVDYGSFFEPKTHRELVDKLVKAHKEGVKVRILVCGPPQPITHNSIFFEKEVHHDGTFHDYYTNNQRFREYYENYILQLLNDKDFLNWLDVLSKDSLRQQIVARFMYENPTFNVDEKIGESPELFDHLVRSCIHRLASSRNEQFIGNDEFITLLQMRQAWFGLKFEDAFVPVKYMPNQAAPIFLWIANVNAPKSRSIFSFAESQTKSRGMGFQTQDGDLVGVFQSIFNNKWDAEPLGARLGMVSGSAGRAGRSAAAPW